MLGQGFEVLAGEDQVFVALDGVGAHLGLTEFDQLSLQLLLGVGQKPLRVEVEPEPPELLGAAHLGIAHGYPLSG